MLEKPKGNQLIEVVQSGIQGQLSCKVRFEVISHNVQRTNYFSQIDVISLRHVIEF